MRFLFLLLLLPLVVCACPPGFYGPSCSTECTYCKRLGSSGQLRYYDCDSQGRCNTCTTTTQYNSTCQNCLKAPSPSTNLFCQDEYPGTTCGGVNQTSLCRCTNTTLYFVPWKTPVLVDQNTAETRVSAGYSNPDLAFNKYCCRKTCPGTSSGCQCQFQCNLPGCVVCDQVNVGRCLQCDQLHYLKNGTCLDCNEGCMRCGPKGAAKIGTSKFVVRPEPGCGSFDACQAETGFCNNECDASRFGQKCEKPCDKLCPNDAVCDSGRNSTGSCRCLDPTLVYSDLLFACVVPVCGNDRSNLCSGNGQCVQNFDNPRTFPEYCVCNQGWNGTLCEKPLNTYQECDCGTLWSSAKRVTAPANISLVQDMPGVQLYAGQPLPVSSVEQAKFLCFQDFLCDGILLWSLAAYGARTNQRDVFPGSVQIAAFFRFDAQGSVSLPQTQFLQYTINRVEQNNCSSPNLDIAFYSTTNATNQAIIRQFCRDTHDNLTQVNLGSAVSYTCDGSFSLADYGAYTPTNYWPNRHWRYVGHQQRFKPNALCDLQPVVFEPSSYCRNARCLSLTGEGPPCVSGAGQRTGYCLPNGDGYQCKCLNFFEAESTGVASLNYQPAFQGLACQFPVSAFCIQAQQQFLCNGVPGACKSARQWNGEFFLENFRQFEQILYQDFVPKCVCDGTPFTGQYCESSRCPNDCKSLSPLAGECTQVGNQSVCVCSEMAIGPQCEVSAEPCVNGGLRCSGRGECRLPDSNHTQPWCVCDQGFFGSLCESYECSPSQMTPGHGVCNSGVAGACYPPYSGTACAVDLCTPYGGVITGKPPSACQCQAPLANRKEGSIVPTCWPQCPTQNGVVCGGGLCLQIEDTSTSPASRSAICQCQSGFILNNLGLCEPFCKHGEVDNAWTAENPTPCVCDISTGFDTDQGAAPRCDHPVCDDHGSLVNSTCTCEPPFVSLSNCAGHQCRDGQVIPWVDGSSRFRCSCVFPRSPLGSLPHDCDGNVCGANGFLNPSPSSSIGSACLCRGKYKTVCSGEVCEFCRSSFCLNGGFPGSDPSVCVCPFPFTGENCEETLCPQVDAVNLVCVCESGLMGRLCDQPICLNGTYSNGTCLCLEGFQGARCETPVVILPGNNGGAEAIITEKTALLSPTQATVVTVVGAVAAATGLGALIFSATRSGVFMAKSLAEVRPLVQR